MNFNKNQLAQSNLGLHEWLSSNNYNEELNDSFSLQIINAIFRDNRKGYKEKIQKLQDGSLNHLSKIGYVAESDYLIYRRGIMFRSHETQEETQRRIGEENHKLLEAIKNNNQKKFNNFYEDEFPKIARLVLSNNGTLENAKDVFQDAIIVVLENVLHKKLDLTCSLGTYIYSVCRNIWLNNLRKRKLVVELQDRYSGINEKVEILSIEDSDNEFDKLTSIITHIGNPCKKLLELFYYHNFTWEQIASELSYANAASARNQKYKCLEKIRKQIQD